MVRLNWIPTDWNTPESMRGVPHSTTFDSIDKLKETMSNCIYNGEWVTDSKGNRLDVDLQEVCLQ
jgi:hypothetical protein